MDTSELSYINQIVLISNVMQANLEMYPERYNTPEFDHYAVFDSWLRFCHYVTAVQIEELMRRALNLLAIMYPGDDEGTLKDKFRLIPNDQIDDELDKL